MQMKTQGTGVRHLQHCPAAFLDASVRVPDSLPVLGLPGCPSWLGFVLPSELVDLLFLGELSLDDSHRQSGTPLWGRWPSPKEISGADWGLMCGDVGNHFLSPSGCWGSVGKGVLCSPSPATEGGSYVPMNPMNRQTVPVWRVMMGDPADMWGSAIIPHAAPISYAVFSHLSFHHLEIHGVLIPRER